MAEPFLSEVRLMSFNFPPKGWAFCNGQLLPINQNQALFALLGVTYGGNGQTTFALPNLRGRVPMHVGAGHTLGEAGGASSHTLNQLQLPGHVHALQASAGEATSADPAGNLLAAGSRQLYAPLQQATPLAPQAVSNVGGSQPHLNMQPYLVLNFCIALQGIFPSQS